jgi:ATP-dependent protease ClpP protease subunit
MIHQPLGGTSQRQASDIEIEAREILRIKDMLNHSMSDMTGANGRMQRILSHNIKVSSSKSFLNQVREICGKKNVWISE